MRVLVFLLVLGNLLFFAWSQGYFGTTPSPDADRVAQQFNPGKMKIVARGDTPPPPETVTAPVAAPAPAAETAAAPTPATPPAPQSCLAWNNLITAEVGRLSRIAAEQAPEAKLTRKVESTTAKAWWVFIPPAASKAELDRKLGELKQLGVGEFFPIQDAGPTRLAISLGVFSTETAARTHLEALRAKGVKTARSGPKSGIEQHVTVELRGAEAELAKLREALEERPAVACAAAAAKP